MLWVVLILGIVGGAIGGGWHSLRLARQGELVQAKRMGRRAALVAGVCGMTLTVPTLGWPFKDVSVSVPEEVSRTVIETVEIPVKVTKWIFWKTTKIKELEEERIVKETVFRTESSRVFSPWLLISMAGVGLLCYWLEKRLVLLAWRWFG